MRLYKDGFGYKRIIIIGNNGSGKSYLARAMSGITGLPLIHLDKEFWLPGWKQPSVLEWQNMQRRFISGEKWIIDGNHSSTMEMRFKAADAVIFLDINRFVCLISVLKRHGKKRSDIPYYIEDRVDREFLQFFRGLWNFRGTRRRLILYLHNKYPDKRFYVLKSRRDVRNFIYQCRVIYRSMM